MIKQLTRYLTAIVLCMGIFIISTYATAEDYQQGYEGFLYDIDSGLPTSAQGMQSNSILIIEDEQGNTMDNDTLYPTTYSQIQLPCGCERLTLEAFALSNSLQNFIDSYYLKGFDAEPMIIGKFDDRKITYTKLKSGQYTFHISVLDAATLQTIKTLSIELNKELTLPERLHFHTMLIFGGIVLGSIIYLIIYRLKICVLTKRQEESRMLADQIIHAFARAIDAKDETTKGHSLRVAQYAKIISEHMGFNKRQAQDVFNIGLLHDIGKIAIPDNILQKKGQLSSAEYGIMKQHTTIGSNILHEIVLLPEITQGAQYHHERFDGGGYESGLSGTDIPIIARIIAVADAFDAMNSDRPYRERLPQDIIRSEIEKGKGGQFDPDIADILLNLLDSGEIVFDDPQNIADK